MWLLNDYKAFQESQYGKYKSTKGQEEFDCNEEQSRLLTLSTYAEGMGAGETINMIEDISRWRPVAPSSAGEAIWKFACGVK